MSEPTLWSQQQEAIFSWFGQDLEGLNRILADLGLEAFVDVTGHLVVRARAGTGKTTTILKAIDRAPEESILLCAFNTSIAAELKKRVGNPRAEAKTLHGVGYGLVRAFLGNVRVDEARKRPFYITDMALASLWKRERMRLPQDLIKLVTKLHTKAREVIPEAKDPGSLLDLAYQFECEPEPKWRAAGYGTALIERIVLDALEIAATDEEGIKRTGIDYADMIFLPVRNNWMAPFYQMVVVDEAQDMSAPQLTLARGSLAPGGRMVVIGDDRQAIYGFRGADAESIDRMKLELHAGELGLNTTYRCGTLIASFASHIVPDFLSGAPHEGEVVTIYGQKTLLQTVEYGDFILSRKNAPLADLALALLRANRRAAIRGRDIGKALVELVKKLADKSDSVPDFLKRLDVWREKEISRAMAAGKEERVDGIIDRAETLLHLTEGVVGLPELCSRIEGLFLDDGQGDAGRVTLSSIHKAKGLEANRVFVLVETLYPTFPRMTPAQVKEEANLAYVAYTRAKHTLVLVRSEDKAPKALPIDEAEKKVPE